MSRRCRTFPVYTIRFSATVKAAGNHHHIPLNVLHATEDIIAIKVAIKLQQIAFKNCNFIFDGNAMNGYFWIR